MQSPDDACAAFQKSLAKFWFHRYGIQMQGLRTLEQFEKAQSKQDFPSEPTNTKTIETMSTTTTEKPDTKIKLTNVRLSYPHLFVPQRAKGSTKEKYSADFILNKKQHAALITQIEKMIERVALTEFRKKVPLKNVCLHDGNERGDKDGYGDDVMYIVAKNDRVFPVVDCDPRIPLTAKDPKPYGGCYVNAVIRLFAYDHETGGKGVSASLEAVQFVRDGESFGAGPVDAEAEFEQVADASDDPSSY